MLKRVKSNVTIQKRYFFLWRECSKCKMEFRRGIGFRVITGMFVEYLCSDCCADKEQVAEYIEAEYEKHKNYISNPPKIPPVRKSSASI